MMQIRIGTLGNGALALGPPVFSTLQKLFDIRVSPTGKAIVFTAQVDNRDEFQLFVLPADGSAPPQLVARNTACYADWSADGHSLVYIRAVNEAADGDQLGLASLTRRVVLNAAGAIEIQTKPEDLAGLLFEGYDKVRCLTDGRILFAAADIHLPCTALDMPQQPQLFALDPQRQTAAIPLVPRSVEESLPAKPIFYEPSPDGKRIALLAEKGAVLVFTPATGVLDTVQAGGGSDTPSAPAWRTASELCFISMTNGQPAQVALWDNGVTRVLSSGWPADTRKGFLDR